jgi:hypothetical protein
MESISATIFKANQATTNVCVKIPVTESIDIIIALCSEDGVNNLIVLDGEHDLTDEIFGKESVKADFNSLQTAIKGVRRIMFLKKSLSGL